MKTINLKPLLHRIEIFKNNIAITTNPNLSNYYFELLDKNFNSIGYFAQMFDNMDKKERSVFITDGEFGFNKYCLLCI
jgi:hypothetical protein